MSEVALSSVNWIAENLWIIDKNGFLIRLEPNIGQLMLHSVMARQRQAGYPVRIILLKPRQVGWSTWSEAEGFYEINTRPNRTGLVVSADTDSTNFVFNMTKVYQDCMPKDLKRITDQSNRKEIIYASPHRSKFITQTAGKDVLGRGGTVHFFHASEVAFWPKAKEGLAAVLQMVPQGDVTTSVILESTANGVGGSFYDMFWQAHERKKTEKDLSGYLPVFFPWYKFPDYNTMTPKGFKIFEDEEELQHSFDMSNEQIFWRRLKIHELGGDEQLFRQEYPATALEAFQTSGNPVFTNKMVNDQKKKAEKEPYCCIFNGRNIDPVNRIFNCWKLVHEPIPGHEYVIGVDTMEARISDPNNVKSNLDCDAAVIIDRTSEDVAAIWHGRGNQKDLAEQILFAGELYNDAWIAPEIPNGMIILNTLKEEGYQNIYNRQTHDEQLTTEDSENLGWRTTTITRKWVVDGLLSVLRDNSFRINFLDIIGEMETFVYDKTGKPIHMQGKHDDLIFALGIAIQVHLRVPMTNFIFADTEPGDTLLREGAIDKGLEFEEDECQEYTE
jgi:hypothetical protein